MPRASIGSGPTASLPPRVTDVRRRIAPNANAISAHVAYAPARSDSPPRHFVWAFPRRTSAHLEGERTSPLICIQVPLNDTRIEEALNGREDEYLIDKSGIAMSR